MATVIVSLSKLQSPFASVTVQVALNGDPVEFVYKCMTGPGVVITGLLSPKFHAHDKGALPSTKLDVNSTDCPAMMLVALTVKVITGLVSGSTLMSSESEATSPSTSITVRFAVKLPPAVYLWITGPCVVTVGAPSPKSHVHDNGTLPPDTVG
jgi:hypothetical protein